MELIHLPLDDPLDQLQLFSRRVTNALMRSGIITPRLLLQHTPEMLLHDIKNLSFHGLSAIEEALPQWGWQLAKTADEQQVTLNRLLAAAFYNVSHPWRLPALTQRVNQFGRVVWEESKIAEGVSKHPYIVEIENGRYQFKLQTVDAPIHPPQLDEPQPTWVTPQGKIMLSDLWTGWLSALDERQQEVLFWRYGVKGNEPLTLKEIGQQISLTRERARQIEVRGIEKLRGLEQRPYRQPLQELFAEAVQRGNGLLAPTHWEQLLDERTVWEADEARPLLLQLLCALFDEYHYLNSYQAATFSHITTNHLRKLDSALKKNLRQHKQAGLTANELTTVVQNQLREDIPITMHGQGFILQAIELFERIGLGDDDRYYYLRKKKKSRHPSANSNWLGEPGTRLHEWELKLRAQFEKIAWIGQLPLTEADFHELCQIIQTEALEPNYFSKELEGQPRLVPAAVFITTMVLTARYAEQLPNEAIDEFWNPYLRNVWGVSYTQAFMARCRKRFIPIVSYLETEFEFVFPRLSEGDVVTPVFRHALIPRYMQTDFATWLRKTWRGIFAVADTPALLAAHLKKDKSLDHYYSHRLKHFVTGKATAETAAALISNMAAAISLHINDGESIESISDLLADTPIEQELWREIAQEFVQDVESSSSIMTRLRQPRLTWIWSLDEAELALRLQNLILPAENNLEGEPDRLIWLDTPDSDLLDAEIEVEVMPWRMKSGEQIVNDVFLSEPDGSINGKIVLLTDMDEVAMQLDVPSYPVNEVQFFRATQQGAYGIPVQPSQVGNGVCYVCAKRPLTLLNNDEPIEPDALLAVPYPLGENYQWAAQFTLNLPVKVNTEHKNLFNLTHSGSKQTIGQPLLSGERPIVGLSRQVQPTFADTQVSLIIEHGGKRLLKQASLWIRGQDGWRWQRPLNELHQQRHAILKDDQLHLNLSQIIPSRPNLYTVELRISLQPLLSAPLQFAVVPNLMVQSFPDNVLHTPANPPQIVVSGIDEAVVVLRKDMQIELLPDGRLQIMWADLRHDPNLTLRFEHVDIPLAWSVPRFMAWLTPKPTKPFLTLEEMKQTTLHAIGSQAIVNSFTMSISGQRGRTFPLKHGRYTNLISRSHLYDMVRLSNEQHTIVNVEVGTTAWTLFEIRQRPNLLMAHVEYDTQEQIVIFSTGLKDSWAGNGRFVAESLTNPFAPLMALGQVNELQDTHLLTASLPDGRYLLRLELDGAWLSLPETAVRFTVGDKFDELIYTQQLVQEIRNGCLISLHLTEDFVLWWAEVAEAGATKLTPTTLYQLATVPATALENFAPQHLQTLWPCLTTIKAVHNLSEWREEHGYLPAWIFSPSRIILQTSGHGFQLRVYPMQMMQGGKYGTGYGRWRISSEEYATKELVYVQWQSKTELLVHVEAGLPETEPPDWSEVDLLDTYGLHYCDWCGRLTGTTNFTLPDEITRVHRHGRKSTNLRDITLPEEHGGYQLLAELLPERRGIDLLDIFNEYEIKFPSATDYLPEPQANTPILMQKPTTRSQLLTLLREIRRYGENHEPTPFWASVTRLLRVWHQNQEVSLLGQTAVAFGILLRTAAYQPHRFRKICKNASLSELDVQNLLAMLNETAVSHLHWALTWAELLKIHSFDGK